MEGNLSGLLQGGEDHADHPEEDDVVACHQHVCGIEILQLRRLFRPAKGGEGPEGGAEPGVQSILVLADLRAAAVRADGHFIIGNGHFAAVVAVPRGDPVAPPELAGDAPVVNVFQPVEIGLAEAFRDELQRPVVERLNGGLRHLFHLHEPLGLDHGLHHRLAAVVGTDSVAMGNYLHQKAQLLQILDDGFSRLIAVHTVVPGSGAVHSGVVVQDADLFQIVAFSYFKVVGVVGRGDLHAAGTELLVNIFVRDHRDLTSGQREFQHLADQVLIALILRVHCHGGIAQHRLRTGGGDLHEAAFFSHDRVVDVPEEAVHIHVLHFRVTDGGLADRAPVDDAGALVDIALVVEADKHFLHGVGAALVHGEALLLPVSGRTQLLQLADDPGAVLLSPVPALLQEAFASQLLFLLSFLAQLVDDLDLCRNGGVVCSGLPQGGIALHPLPADQDILHRVVQGVAHMQLSGDVRRRHHDGKGLPVRIHLRAEISLFKPFLIQTVLDLGGHIGLGKYLHDYLSFLQHGPVILFPLGYSDRSFFHSLYRIALKHPGDLLLARTRGGVLTRRFIGRLPFLEWQ